MGVKSRSKKNRPAGPASSGIEPRANLKRRLILVLSLLAAFVGAWAFFEFVVWNRVPPELVGKWEVTEGPREYQEASFQFYRNGNVEGFVNVAGDLRIIKSTMRVDGKKITVTSKHPKTGEEKVQVQLIRTLTAKELVVEDEQGIPLKMKRVD